MNISYKWLSTYLPSVKTMTPQQVADALTEIGLETGSIEKVDMIKGGLQGIMVGKVLTCLPHPNSDHLHCTTVSIGSEEPLKIVCGAPNVAQGQYVLVATIGTTIYHGEEHFIIKKSKLRGEESFGMLCSEVELGLGNDNSGIKVLEDSPKEGTSAADYFNLESDYVLEVDITPNRVDATSHFGVARDLAAYLSRYGNKCKALLPTIAPIKISNSTESIKVIKEVSSTDCPRYQAVLIQGVDNRESPKWLKEALETIGIHTKNLLVDLSNFILHETGQPLHIFDADKIQGKTIHIKTLPKGTRFTSLDEIERELNGSEIMICDNEQNPLCMAGVIGGHESAVTLETKNIFIECANFNSTLIRKAARAHALNTDSSFRFERGLDPNATEYALARIVALILETAGGEVCGDIIDLYEEAWSEPQCILTFNKLYEVMGTSIPKDIVESILLSLDITIIKKNSEEWLLSLPIYRIDVRREIDVIEEILRIYGYNEIPLKGYIHANLSTRTETDLDYHTEIVISEQLTGAGYNEILANSLSAERYYNGLDTYKEEQLVQLLNPLSRELSSLRQTLLFGGLEAISRNIKGKASHCSFYEWGNCYFKNSEKSNDQFPLAPYTEKEMLSLWITGTIGNNNWAGSPRELDAAKLKGDVENIFSRCNIPLNRLYSHLGENDIFSDYLEYRLYNEKGEKLAWWGKVRPEILQIFDINQAVYFAEIDRALLMETGRKNRLQAKDINKYPVVKRDLALLLHQSIPFAKVEQVARKSESKLLQKVELFDVYTGKNLPEGTKSYAVSFFLQDENSTLTDKQIEKTMARIQEALEKELKASLR